MNTNGIVPKDRIDETRLPKADSFIASIPFPVRSISCMGSIARALSASGAPRKTEGIISRKVWVTAFVTIMSVMDSGENPSLRRKGVMDARIRANVLV